MKWFSIFILSFFVQNCCAQLFKQQYELLVHEHQTVVFRKPDVSLISLNTYGVHIAPHKHNRMQNIGEFILESDAEIILLQEVFMHKHARMIWNSVKEKYPFAVIPTATPISGRTSGLMILSKFPVLEVKSITFHTRQGIDVLMPKGFLMVLLKVANQQVWVANTHLQAGNFPWVKRAQLAQIATLIDNVDTMILGGDFNIDFFKEQTLFQFLQEKLKVGTENLFGYSSDNCNPLCTSLPERLDYFLTKQIIIGSQQVVDNVFFSDHFPIMSKIILQNNTVTLPSR